MLGLLSRPEPELRAFEKPEGALPRPALTPKDEPGPSTNSNTKEKTELEKKQNGREGNHPKRLDLKLTQDGQKRHDAERPCRCELQKL